MRLGRLLPSRLIGRGGPAGSGSCRGWAALTREPEVLLFDEPAWGTGWCSRIPIGYIQSEVDMVCHWPQNMRGNQSSKDDSLNTERPR